jgi:hypothetical protein
MTKALKSTAQIIASLWVGILFCLGFVVAPYLFALAACSSPAVPNTGIAADLIGPLLYSSDILGLIVGAVLILALLFLRRHDEIPLGGKHFLSEIGVAIAVACAALNYWVVTPRLNSMRDQIAERYGAFHLADRADPLFQQFSWLHQTSTTVFMIGFGAALVCLVCMTQFRSRRAAAA